MEEVTGSSPVGSTSQPAASETGNPMCFAPVTGREFRLVVLSATDGPTIAEIELLPKR